jgi:hypothetical protein
MIAASFIIIVSIGLFLFWFRCTCRLMLSSQPSRDLTSKITEANQLQFRAVQRRLDADSGFALDELDQFYQALNCDHRVIVYLMKYGALYRTGDEDVERFLLEIDFRMMSAIYRASRAQYKKEAEAALREMASVLNYFTNSMGATVFTEPASARVAE